MGKGDIAKFNNGNIIKDTAFASKLLSHCMQVSNLNLYYTKPKTREELEDRFAKYFELCIKNGFPPNNEGLALVAGYDRRCLYEMGVGHQRLEFSDTVKRAKDFVAMYDTNLAASGKMPAPIYIFRAKNYLGMKDEQHIVASVGDDATTPKNAEEILNQIPELPENKDKIIEIEKTSSASDEKSASK